MYEVFEFPIGKQPKVIRKKLGKYKVHAQYDVNSKYIEIDSRFKGKKELILFIHEYFHHIFPNFSEEQVREYSEKTADFLWKHHYRKVDNNE